MELDSEQRDEKKRPNLFISLQVDSQEIQRNMEDFQTRCLDKEPKLKSFLVSPKKAHITLLVLHVEDDRMEEAKSIFAQCRDHFSNDKMFEVEFSGVGAFGNRVLFAKPTGNLERIARLSEIFEAKYSEENFPCEYKPDPHLTLMKVKAKRKALKKIPSSSYDGLEDYRFGIQAFRTVQLLSMTKPVAESGNYFCEAELQLNDESAKTEEIT